MFENLRRGGQARNFTKNVPKILDLKSSSEQIFFENWRWVPLTISFGSAHTYIPYIRDFPPAPGRKTRCRLWVSLLTHARLIDMTVAQNSAVKLFWNFKNKLLSGRKSHQFEFSGQVNSVLPNSENKSRLPVVLFFKRYFLVLEAL